MRFSQDTASRAYNCDHFASMSECISAEIFCIKDTSKLCEFHPQLHFQKICTIFSRYFRRHSESDLHSGVVQPSIVL